MERKPQKNSQIDFIKLTLEHKRGSTEKGQGPPIWFRGWRCLAAFINWEQSGLARKGGLFESGGLSLPVPCCLVTMFPPALWGRVAECLLLLPRKVVYQTNLDQLCMRNSGFQSALVFRELWGGGILVISLFDVFFLAIWHSFHQGTSPCAVP